MKNKLGRGKSAALLSGLVLLAGVGIQVSAVEKEEVENKETAEQVYEVKNWTANTVEEIKKEINEQQVDEKYIIKWGDTLWGLSQATGVTIDELVELNRINNPDLIFAGDELFGIVSTADGVERAETTPTDKATSTSKKETTTSNKVESVSNKATSTNNKATSTTNKAESESNKGDTTTSTGTSTGNKEDKPSTGTPSKPSTGTPDKPSTGTPEVEKPEVEKPEVEKPEVEKPEEDNSIPLVPLEPSIPNEKEPEEQEPEVEEGEKEPVFGGEEGETEEPGEEVEGEPELGEPEIEEPETEEDEVVVTTQTETKRNTLTAGVRVVKDNTLEKGKVVVEEEGKDGFRVLETVYTYEDGVLVNTSEPTVVEEQLPVTRVERHGTKELVGYTKEEKVTTVIKHGTKVVEDATKFTDYRNVTEGTDGKRTVTYQVEYNAQGTEVKRTKVDEQVVKAKDEVIVVGTKKRPVLSEDTIYERKEVDFTTEYVYVNKPKDYRKVVQKGTKGVDHYTYKVTYEDGKEISRKEIGKETERTAKPEIIEIGMGSDINNVSFENEVKFDMAKVQQIFHNKLNDERLANGKGALGYKSDLDSASHRRAFEVRHVGGEFSHTRPDGTNFRTVDEQLNEYTAGENILYYGVGKAQTEEKIADTLFEVWKNSQGHYENMMEEAFTHQSVGIYTQVSNGVTYYSAAQILFIEY